MINSVQKLKWQNLANIHKLTSSLELCISEFVDNSITSFEKDCKDRHNESLNIYIEYINDLDKNIRKYIITDNAAGMNDMNEAMNQYDGPEDRDNTNKSNYGIGMKFGIFWIGKNGTIFSKKINDYTYCGKFIKNNDGDVENQIIKLENSQEIKTDSGTKIIIEDTWSSDGKLTGQKYKDLKNFLGLRYSYYINKENNILCNIYISSKEIKNNLTTFKTSNNKEFELIEPYNMFDEKNILNINDLCNNDLEKIKLCKENLLEKIKQYDNNSINVKLFTLLYENKPLIIEDASINITVNNEQKNIKCKFAILKEPCDNKCGVLIKQSGRYICHPTFWKKIKDFGSYQWSKNDRFINGYFKWCIAEINLQDIPYNNKCEYIYPDQNKSKIKFANNPDDYKCITEDDFNCSLENFLKKINSFLSTIVQLNNDKKKVISLSNAYDKNDGIIANSCKPNFDNQNNTLEAYVNKQGLINLNEKFETKEINIDDEWRMFIQYKELNDNNILFECCDYDDEQKLIKYDFNLKCKMVFGSLDNLNNESVLIIQQNISYILCYIDFINKLNNRNEKYAISYQIYDLFKKHLNNK